MSIKDRIQNIANSGEETKVSVSGNSNQFIEKMNNLFSNRPMLKNLVVGLSLATAAASFSSTASASDFSDYQNEFQQYQQSQQADFEAFKAERNSDFDTFKADRDKTQDPNLVNRDRVHDQDSFNPDIFEEDRNLVNEDRVHDQDSFNPDKFRAEQFKSEIDIDDKNFNFKTAHDSNNSKTESPHQDAFDELEMGVEKIREVCGESGGRLNHEINKNTTKTTIRCSR